VQGLIDFILNYKHWLVFILLEVVSLLGLFSSDGYQKSVFFTTANSIVGTTYSAISSVTSYLNLGEVNRELETENEHLRMENLRLKKRLRHHDLDSISYEGMDENYHVVVAQVIKSTLHRSTNLITIDKGEAEGIRPEMGVVSSKGVVGVVYMTSSHYSIVMPLLNVNCKISCRIRATDYFGTLEWERGNSRVTYVTRLPRHAKMSVGDIVETNGYSDIFPPGIPIGKVAAIGDSEDGMSYKLKVNLNTNFATLRDVSIITNYVHQERRELETEVEKENGEDTGNGAE